LNARAEIDALRPISLRSSASPNAPTFGIRALGPVLKHATWVGIDSN